ncbi:hypothetical protein [Streptomyces sp. NPDC058683]|uniref:hypothetical protein n=1 Tax=Streptomyces sp. NPDC058683 TaxID=3346597 RepID=UPI0036684CFD
MAFGVPVAIASVGTTEGPRRWQGCCSALAWRVGGLGIWRLVQALRTREQCFDTHERGFTHRMAGTASARASPASVLTALPRRLASAAS